MSAEIQQFVDSYLDGVGAFDGSNDEPRDRAYVLSGLEQLLAAEREKARAPFLRIAAIARTREGWTGQSVAEAIEAAAEDAQ